MPAFHYWFESGKYGGLAGKPRRREGKAKETRREKGEGREKCLRGRGESERMEGVLSARDPKSWKLQRGARPVHVLQCLNKEIYI